MRQNGKNRRRTAGGAQQRHGDPMEIPRRRRWRDLVALTELRGAAGENSKAGADGKKAVDGRNGTNGKDGVNGTDGKDGVDGKNGADGKDGINGTNGKDGIDGKDGINGTDGKDGINGTDGKNGLDGTDGKNGLDGKDGVDGINAKSIEVRRAGSHIQWRYEGDKWQNLVAIADITGSYRAERSGRSKRKNAGDTRERKHPAVALHRR